MKEWKIEIPDELIEELKDCFILGPIINDDEIRTLNEEVIDQLNGLTMYMYSNEHPPPHFHVCFQGKCNGFTIDSCEPSYGNALSAYFRNINKWHKKNKNKLIKLWNKKRPSDCPVGNYRESQA